MVASYKLRRELSGETNSADTFALDCQLSEHEKIHFSYLSPPVSGIWQWQS